MVEVMNKALGENNFCFKTPFALVHLSSQKKSHEK